MKTWIRRCLTAVTLIFVLAAATDRIYEYWTDGFSVSQILSDRIGTKAAVISDLNFDQEFHYLGKGCQSYAFLSEDGELVIKFIKYKHFRVPSWQRAFSFIPAVEKSIQKKEKKKRHNLRQLFDSWKIAHEHLPKETGIVYLHIDTENRLNRNLKIRDKMGLLHEVEAGSLDFLVQKRAAMLGPVLKQAGTEEGKKLITDLLDLLIEEYQKGFGDLDHALLQNTGVIAGRPAHIDVGQIVYREEFKDPEVYHQEIYHKTYAFRIWLRNEKPELANHLDAELKRVIGEKFDTMKHSLKHVN